MKILVTGAAGFIGFHLAEALLANMPSYAEQYPLGIVRRVVPMDLVDGRSDVPPA